MRMQCGSIQSRRDAGAPSERTDGRGRVGFDHPGLCAKGGGEGKGARRHFIEDLRRQRPCRAPPPPHTPWHRPSRTRVEASPFPNWYKIAQIHLLSTGGRRDEAPPPAGRPGGLRCRDTTFYGAMEPSAAPQNLPPRRRTFRRATEPSVAPQNLPSRHRTFRRATEPSVASQNLPSRHRTFRRAIEPSVTP